MAQSWHKRVRKSGILSVYNGINAGKWANVFKGALDGFNNMPHQLGVTVAEASDKSQADVIMELSKGNSTFSYRNTTAKATFDASLAHGKTIIFHENNIIEKAVVFLPEKPRETHIDILKFIAIHELVHACGLDNSEHASDGVFMTLPNIRDGKAWAQQDSQKMPPYFLAAKTVALLNEVWKKDDK